MEEILNNQQVRPGDVTQFMHAIFSSDDEMMTFYLTLNRFINPESYLLERTAQQRLDDLASALYRNVAACNAVCSCKSISVKEVIKGFGEYMMSTFISNTNRRQSAEAVGTLVNCIMNTTKNWWQFKQMNQTTDIHLENVKYLLNRLNTKTLNTEALNIETLNTEALNTETLNTELDEEKDSETVYL